MRAFDERVGLSELQNYRGLGFRVRERGADHYTVSTLNPKRASNAVVRTLS